MPHVLKSHIQNLFTKLRRDFFIWIPIIIIPLLYTKKTLDPVLTVRFIVFSGFLILFAFALLKKIREEFSNNFKIQFNWFFVFLLLYIIVSGASLFYTLNLVDGIFEFQKILMQAIFIFYLVYYVKKIEEFTLSILKNLIVLNSIVLGIGLYQLDKMIVNDVLSHQNMYLITAAFAHKNIFSEVLLILFPFSVAAFFILKKFWKYLSVAIAFLNLFFIAILASRAVWIAFLASFLSTLILVIIVLFIKRSATFKKLTKKILLVGSFAVISGGIAIYFYANQGQTEILKRQTEKIVNFNYGSVQDRIELWKRSYQMFKENPVTGIGLASWKIEILKYGNRNLFSEDQVTFYQRPHNDLIWILNEQGALGLIIYLLVVASIVIYIIKILIKSDNQNTLILILFSFFALSGYFVFSLFSFPKERIEHNIFLSLILALVILIYNKNSSGKLFNARYLKLFLYITIGILVFSIITGFNRFNAEKHMRNAFIARANSNWIKLIAETEKVNDKYYKIDPYSTPLSWYKGIAYYNLKSFDKAFSEFQKAYKTNPYHIHVLNNLGTAYELQKNHKKALKFYKEAIHISPKFEDAILNLCAVEYNLGKLENAYNAIRKIDTESINEKYRNYAHVVLKDICKKVSQQISEEDLIKVIFEIQNDEIWLFDIYKKSILENVNIENQIIRDAIYTNEKIHAKISPEQAEVLQVKYANLLIW